MNFTALSMYEGTLLRLDLRCPLIESARCSVEGVGRLVSNEVWQRLWRAVKGTVVNSGVSPAQRLILCLIFPLIVQLHKLRLFNW